MNNRSSPTVLEFTSRISQSPQQIRQELLDSQLKVASLQDMSLQLLVNSQGSDCLEAKEKVHVIGNRLKLLLKEVTRDLRELAKILDITSSQQVDLHSLYIFIYISGILFIYFLRNQHLCQTMGLFLQNCSFASQSLKGVESN